MELSCKDKMTSNLLTFFIYCHKFPAFEYKAWGQTFSIQIGNQIFRRNKFVSNVTFDFLVILFILPVQQPVWL